jgi:hypothetical protein
MLRIFIFLFALATLGYCAFGFLATFEPPGFVKARIAWGLVGAACAAVAACCVVGRARAA